MIGNHKCDAFVVFVLNYCMKKTGLLCFLLLPTLIFCQKNFEGIVSYKGHSTIDGSKTLMRVYYSKNKMKLESSEEVLNTYKNEPKSMVIDFKKGIQYLIDTLLETVEVDSLKYKDPEDMDSEFLFLPTDITKKILGNDCRLYNAKTTIDDSTLVVPESMFAMWFSENIKYIIPESYRNKRSLLTSPDGNCIWLESSLTFKSPLIKKKGAIDSISYKAILIEPQILPDSIFNIPSQYILKYRDYGSSTETIELTEIISEEAIKPDPPPPPPPKPLKSPAKKTKQTKPVKG